MTVFTAGSWYCDPSAARLGRQYWTVLLMYVRVYYTETLPLFPSWNSTEGVWSFEYSSTSFLFKVTAQVQTK